MSEPETTQKEVGERWENKRASEITEKEGREDLFLLSLLFYLSLLFTFFFSQPSPEIRKKKGGKAMSEDEKRDTQKERKREILINKNSLSCLKCLRAVSQEPGNQFRSHFGGVLVVTSHHSNTKKVGPWSKRFWVRPHFRLFCREPKNALFYNVLLVKSQDGEVVL